MGDVEQADIPATATPDGSPAAAQGAGETPTATGNGAVVVSGQFPAGTVVKCYLVDSEATLRVDADATLVGERMSDDNGDVGFPGLEQGARYFVCGYVDGTLLEIRCVGQDPEAPNAPLGQPPVQPLPTTVGTQQEKVEPVPPAPPADSIPVGIDPAAQPAAADSPGIGNLADGLFLHVGGGEIDPVIWPVANERVPSEAPDGAPTPLYDYVGATLAEVPEGWELYTGPTESVPAPAAAPEASPAAEPVETSAAPPAEPAAPVDSPNPPAPDAGTPDASESSGTGQANGGAIEQASPEQATVTSGGTATTNSDPAAEGTKAEPASPVAPLDPSAQPTPAVSDTPSPDAPAPEVDQPAADPAAAPAAAADPAPDAPASS